MINKEQIEKILDSFNARTEQTKRELENLIGGFKEPDLPTVGRCSPKKG